MTLKKKKKNQDVHLSFLLRNGLLLAALYVLKALQEGQQRGAGSLGGALVVHLSGAAFPKTEQQQNGRQQLTGETPWQNHCISAAGGFQHRQIRRDCKVSGYLRVPLCTASSSRMARARCWSWRGMLPLVLALPCTSLKRQENYLFIITIQSYLLFERLYSHQYSIISSLHQWHRIVLQSQEYGSSQLLTLTIYHPTKAQKVCRISSSSVNNKPEELGGPLNHFQPHRWYSSLIEQCSLWQSTQGIQRLLEEFAAKICIVSCKNTSSVLYTATQHTEAKTAKHEDKRRIYMIFVYTIFSCFPKSGSKIQLMHISIRHLYCGVTQIWSKNWLPYLTVFLKWKMWTIYTPPIDSEMLDKWDSNLACIYRK